MTIDQKLGQADPTNTGPIGFTATFSESVSGFDESDVTIAGTAGGTKTVVVTGGPTVYGIAVSGMTTNGTVIASIDADKASDTAGNGNAASTSIDNTVTWTQQATSDIHVRFQAPLDESMTTTSKIINKAKNGRVLPVQIELYRGTKKLTSADVAEGQVQLLVTRMTTCDAVTGDDIETYAPAGSSNTGTLFRWAGTKMVFNLDTANKSRGIRRRLVLPAGRALRRERAHLLGADAEHAGSPCLARGPTVGGAPGSSSSAEHWSRLANDRQCVGRTRESGLPPVGHARLTTVRATVRLNV